MKKAYYLQIVRYLLIVLWIYAAGSKLWAYGVFKDQLSRQALPHWLVQPLSWLLPLTELVTVLLLSLRRTIIKGFLLSFALMLAFTFYVGLGLVRAYDNVPCSCGGILGSMGWPAHFVFNIVFTILAGTGLFLMKVNDAPSVKYHSMNA